MITKDTKVMFETNRGIREGVVVTVHRPTMNLGSEPTAYTVKCRGNEHTVAAEDVVEAE